MGAKHVTPEEIVEMHLLYDRFGTYAAVAEKVKRSTSTVSKYIKMKGVPRNIQITVMNLLKEQKRDVHAVLQ